MERRTVVKTAAGKVVKWWARNWVAFVQANGHPVDRLVGPALWEKK